MAFLTTLGLLAGGANALREITGGRSKRMEALRGLEAFERQDLVNAYEGLKPSLDVERTALAGLSEQRATVADVAAGNDAASALALLSTGNEAVNKQQLDIYNAMFKQEADFDVMAAKDETAMRNIRESRDAADIASLQAQLYAGEKEMSNALMGMAEMATSVGLMDEMRKAGLGYDEYQAALDRINEGTGGAMDYLNAKKYGGFFQNPFRKRP